MHFLEKLKSLESIGQIPKEVSTTLRDFYYSYESAIRANGRSAEEQMPFLNTFLDLVKEQIETPFQFAPYHEKITSPFDFFSFGLDFLRPIVKLDRSSILGEKNILEIETLLHRRENVILFSNHQIEPDPQAISLLLEDSHKELSQNLISVAGHRVTTDPLAVPFSKGRNLLCIYSKKYIEHPPEKKQEKVRHNQKSIKKMQELLSEGGKCIYVAPSGGRDRLNKDGILEVAPFEAQNIEMFWFLAKHSLKPMHFFPLALYTFDLLPPPDTVSVRLGENRRTKSSPIHLSFGEEIDMVHFPGSENEDKKARKTARAKYIWDCVNTLYKMIYNKEA